MPKLITRVIFVEQIEELGEASPKDAFTKPDDKANVFEKNPPTRGCLLSSMGFTRDCLTIFFFENSAGMSSQSFLSLFLFMLLSGRASLFAVEADADAAAMPGKTAWKSVFQGSSSWISSSSIGSKLIKSVVKRPYQ